jgi:hypothetical protein
MAFPAFTLNPSWHGLAMPSTSFVGRSRVTAGKLVDARAKPWHDEYVAKRGATSPTP